MCVSTGNAGTPNAWVITTLAVLWPTPGRASSSSNVRGTSPPCCATRIFDSSATAFDFVVDSQKDTGLLSRQESNAVMYEHGIATVMLFERLVG